MYLSMDEETAEQERARLRRELDHLDSQCRTNHRMAMSLKDDNQVLQKTVASLEKKLETWRKKLTEHPKGQPVSEATLALWSAEAEQPDKAPPAAS